MLSMQQIRQQYPEHLHRFGESLLKEYLQYKILFIIFTSSLAHNLVFLGGTAIRIIHNGVRFSEDLDFDNFDLSVEAFVELGDIIKKELELEGLSVEVSTRTQRAFSLNIRIPKLLHEIGFSNLPQQKILMKVDTEPQHFDFEPELFPLNKFEVLTPIYVVPKDILLAQKIFAAINRTRPKGRDFFDIVFLCGIGAKPDLDYLKLKLGVSSIPALKNVILQRTQEFNFSSLAKDVEPFLFDPRENNKVLHFRKFIEQKF